MNKLNKNYILCIISLVLGLILFIRYISYKSFNNDMTYTILGCSFICICISLVGIAIINALDKK